MGGGRLSAQGLDGVYDKRDVATSLLCFAVCFAVCFARLDYGGCAAVDVDGYAGDVGGALGY